MKIKIEQLSQAKSTVIVDCLRKIGEQRKNDSGYTNNWYLEIAREIEHGELLLCKYIYNEQEGGDV